MEDISNDNTPIEPTPISKEENEIRPHGSNHKETTERCTPETITSLKENEVFVFGTNQEGKHKAPAAKLAVSAFGAQMGLGNGFSGQSYAIPVHHHHMGKMYEAVRRFIVFAENHPEKIFYVLPIGCGKGGMDPMTVATMFKKAAEMENVFLPKIFREELDKAKNLDLRSFNPRCAQLLHSEIFEYGLVWSLYGNGVLEISGLGGMPNYINHWDSYTGGGQAPWIGCEKYGVLPDKLVIANGITYVGANAFECFGCLKEVYLAPTVNKLGKMAFFDCFHIEKINVPPHMNIEDFEIAELPLYYDKCFVRVGDWLIDKSLDKNE